MRLLLLTATSKKTNNKGEFSWEKTDKVSYLNCNLKTLNFILLTNNIIEKFKWFAHFFRALEC